MTSIDTLSRPLVHRARTLAGLAVCAVAVAIASSIGLALGIVAHILSWPVLDVPGVSLVLVIVAAATGYGVGRTRPIATSALLLRADVGLGTEARLSTLHAIGDRHDLQPYAVRIAAGLSARPLTPHIALPIPRKVIALLAAGITIALATVVLMVALPDPRAQAPYPGLFPGALLPTDVPSRRASAGLSPTDPVHASSDGLAAKAPASTAPAASGSASEESDVDVVDLPTRPQSTLSLEETLQQIEGHVAADQESTLSDSELAALRSFADAAPSPLAEALRELMAASKRAETLARVRAVLARPDVAAQTGTRSREAPSADSGLEPVAVAAGPEGESALTPAGLPASTPEEPSGHGKYPFFDEPTGGPAEITLIGSTLPSAIGTAGEYSYYVTKSVPVEPPVADPSTPAGTPLSLSFERATSIAASRALPSDVLGAVRAYFTQITEGGP